MAYFNGKKVWRAIMGSGNTENGGTDNGGTDTEITGLTGTTWLWNEQPTMDIGIPAISGNLNFTSNGTNYTSITVNANGGGDIWYEGKVVYDNSENSWSREAYRTITIIDGVYATNAYLIAWLKANATQVIQGTEGLAYKISTDGTYALLDDIGTATDTDIVIASVYNGVPVTHIGYQVFWNDNITSITIPDTVTNIEDYWSGICKGLQSVKVSANNKNYQSIDGVLYTKDGKTLCTYPYGKTDTDFTVPEHVTCINRGAIQHNDYIESVTIPNSVTDIGSGVLACDGNLTSVTIGGGVVSIPELMFESCENLTTIKFNGTVAQWGAMEKGYGWNSRVPATKVICIDGNATI